MWTGIWILCGWLTFVVMWAKDRSEGRKFKFVDTESVLSIKYQLFLCLVVFLLGPIGFILTVVEWIRR